MRKSNKCSYSIGPYKKDKRKFLRPEDAINESKKLNMRESTLHLYQAYKCTVCHFFHIGRSNVLNDNYKQS